MGWLPAWSKLDTSLKRRFCSGEATAIEPNALKPLDRLSAKAKVTELRGTRLLCPVSLPKCDGAADVQATDQQAIKKASQKDNRHLNPTRPTKQDLPVCDRVHRGGRHRDAERGRKTCTSHMHIGTNTVCTTHHCVQSCVQLTLNRTVRPKQRQEVQCRCVDLTEWEPEDS